jgi:hypothetical protein
MWNSQRPIKDTGSTSSWALAQRSLQTYVVDKISVRMLKSHRVS